MAELNPSDFNQHSIRPVKPIETRYRGYRFRSRLEARWAVFFDTMKFAWKYEPEGFQIGKMERYLPDFFVSMPNHFDMFPGAGMWIEIKPIAPNRHEVEKLRSVCAGTGHVGKILFGLPGENDPVCIYRDGRIVGEVPMPDPSAWHNLMCICLQCTPDYFPDLDTAIDAARGARFENR